VFVPDRLVLETLDGTLIDSCDHAEATFADQMLETPWDAFHFAYFASETASGANR
jgi:hypothetical protein